MPYCLYISQDVKWYLNVSVYYVHLVTIGNALNYLLNAVTVKDTIIYCSIAFQSKRMKDNAISVKLYNIYHLASFSL